MSADQRPERPRSFAFHWIVNILLATLALFAGALFGERIPKDKLGLAFMGVAAVALALVPLTRRWENAGIEKRRAGPGPEKKTPGDH
ncbi:MAG: hypothetical protein ACR2FO_07940 [Actinomycetota bacterium]